ncbi:hypothetical protein TNCV_1346361 [Trichonephila clavipes]|nr:hypothetical protein TNCV_1346361 [Trichonephila clavipes]
MPSNRQRGQNDLSRFHPNFEGEHPRAGQGPPTSLAPISLQEGTIHLETSMSSPGFEPRPKGTAVSVANHCTGWVTDRDLNKFI